ncbi:uncharacterized protein LOC111338241 [Stylophora pistillata]|uniref:uncharacterized protein LOC111338241 n=1 Tax=Stylophora pistillata TaxID=50429 RepID=UPI000C03AE7B|nr:uncharacterized protein LOC111338241 [Stylophora pistillata]
MVNFCAVCGCSNRSNRNKDKRFLGIPTVKSNVGDNLKLLQKQRQSEWVKRIKREDLTPDKYSNARVCSDHFVSDLYDTENADWAPSLNLGHNFDENVDGKRKDRYDLIKEKRRKSEGAQALLEQQNLTEFLQEEPVKATDCVTATGVNESTTETSKTSIKPCETQTDTNSSDIQALEAEIKSLGEDNSKVIEQLNEVSLDVKWVSRLWCPVDIRDYAQWSGDRESVRV